MIRRLLGTLLLVSLLGLVLLAGAALVALHMHGEQRAEEMISEGLVPAPAPVTAAQIARGAYLADAGNCAGCHTDRGGAPYAGGRPIGTPFGTVYSPNLTPDAATGLGTWSALHFRRALQQGRSRDGRLLVPAFPYPHYTLMAAEDADAIHAYLASLPAVTQPNRAHALRFPYDGQLALALWRALYFRPGRFAPDPAQPADWNRGAYLVQALGHCGACHAERNPLGATAGADALGGGLIPMQNWYAPSLAQAHEAGVADWSIDEVTALLRTGQSGRASVLGPMAQVVLHSTQHLDAADLQAMARYLQSLAPPPGGRPPAPRPAAASGSAAHERGARVYEEHCADCHGRQGEGAGTVYPMLAGNRAVAMEPPVNVVRVVLEGGFPPATAANPRPYGMPPFATTLGDEDIAAVVSYVRASWGHQASALSSVEVNRLRAGTPR